MTQIENQDDLRLIANIILVFCVYVTFVKSSS